MDRGVGVSDSLLLLHLLLKLRNLLVKALPSLSLNLGKLGGVVGKLGLEVLGSSSGEAGGGGGSNDEGAVEGKRERERVCVRTGVEIGFRVVEIRLKQDVTLSCCERDRGEESWNLTCERGRMGSQLNINRVEVLGRGKEDCSARTKVSPKHPCNFPPNCGPSCPQSLEGESSRDPPANHGRSYGENAEPVAARARKQTRLVVFMLGGERVKGELRFDEVERGAKHAKSPQLLCSYCASTN